MTTPLMNKEAVFSSMTDHPAIAALRNWKDAAVADAKFAFDELMVTIAPDDIREACRTVQSAGYNFLEDVTCVDWYPTEPRFHVTYHIWSLPLKERLRLRVVLDSVDPSVDSITPVWPSANFYEREVFDLFGVRFNGHPNLRRIMMPDDWEGHPLRKDYPVEGYR
ncbi:MAG TPA: NADH-quinone oxidoreductase subunit C [Acidisarcina sp.]|nr:NADH-quinone oxidoreductase subunit C [Acidisarcina sp.]